MSASVDYAANGRLYDPRDYIDRTISTIRQHEPDALRNNWWTGAALALADEVDKLRLALDMIASPRNIGGRDALKALAREARSVDVPAGGNL